MRKKASLRVRMEIRSLTINEYEAITQLWKRAKLPFKPNGRDSREAISKEMVANSDFHLGAFEQDRLIGVVILSCDKRKGWINRLAIDPEYRSQGVAKALIFESERILRTRGVKIFCVLIEADNIPSKKLFKECSYTERHDITYFSKRDNEEIQTRVIAKQGIGQHAQLCGSVRCSISLLYTLLLLRCEKNSKLLD